MAIQYRFSFAGNGVLPGIGQIFSLYRWVPLALNLIASNYVPNDFQITICPLF